jgi:hypothetical protein
MATVASPRKASKSAKPFSCSFISITVAINDTRYSVDQTDPGECGSRSFRLCKRSGNHEVYDLVRTHAGIVECTCPDYESRHRGNGFGTCKHGKALVELGLMPAPIAPEFAPAKGIHAVTTLPVAAPRNHFEREWAESAPAVEVAPAPAPIAPEPCCAPSEAEPCRECVEASVDGLQMEDRASDAAPTAQCICPTCTEDVACVAAESEDAGPAEAWGPEWDIDVWMLGADAPEPGPDGPDDGPSAEDRAEAERGARELLNPAGPPTLTLAELVEKQVQFYLAWQTDAGDLIAGQLDQLASRIRFLDARSPAEFSARGDVMDRDDRDATYRQGFEAALAERRAMEAASAFGHGV